MKEIVIRQLEKGYSVVLRTGLLSKQEFAFETCDRVIEFLKGAL
jgi:hypothetical protein